MKILSYLSLDKPSFFIIAYMKQHYLLLEI